MELLERQIDELECCAAVFCQKGEFEADMEALFEARNALTSGEPVLKTLSCRITLEVEGCSEPIALRAVLPAEYPLVSPILEVSSPALPKRLAADICGALERHCNNAGEECLVELAHMMSSLYLDAYQQAGSEKQHVTEPQEDSLGATVVFIDHMNDSHAYLRKISGWMAEYSLAGVLLYNPKSTNPAIKGATTVPRGRIEDIYLVLEGCEADRSRFMTLLRTQRLTPQDVKERKSQVLWQSDKSWSSDKQLYGNSFEIVPYTSSEELMAVWRDKAAGLHVELGQFRRTRAP